MDFIQNTVAKLRSVETIVITFTLMLVGLGATAVLLALTIILYSINGPQDVNTHLVLWSAVTGSLFLVMGQMTSKRLPMANS